MEATCCVADCCRPLAGLLEWIERSRENEITLQIARKCNWWV